MNGFPALHELTVVFAMAVLVAVLLRRIGIPTLAGLIIAGALTGPNALGLISDGRHVDRLADLGIILLLFGIGIELSLERLRRLWKAILLGGTLQVTLTIAAVSLFAYVTERSLRQALFLGILISVSSTAVVLRGLQLRGEIDAPHGRLTLGILVFQDLCVVPLMAAIRWLSEGTSSSAHAEGSLLATAIFVLAVPMASRWVVPRILGVVARTRERDLFVLSVFLICLGTLWVAAYFGISLALGAFFAGLIVAGSDFRHQALSEVIPFREVLAALFFVSVGMLVDPAAILMHPVRLLQLTIMVIAAKFVVVLVVGILMRLPLRVSILTAMALAQIGEFSFILLRSAEGTRLLASDVEALFPAVVVISMLLTPFLLRIGPHLAAGVGRIRGLTRLLGVQTPEEMEESGKALQDHVIIAGFGLAGRELAHSLRNASIPYVIVELNSETVRKAVAEGEPACFGDVTSVDVLERLGIRRARELAILVNDPNAAERAVAAAHDFAPEIPVLVRTQYLNEVERLFAKGANVVVPAEVEAAAEITARVLKRHDVSAEILEKQITRIQALRFEEVP